MAFYKWRYQQNTNHDFKLNEENKKERQERLKSHLGSQRHFSTKKEQMLRQMLLFPEHMLIWQTLSSIAIGWQEKETISMHFHMLTRSQSSIYSHL